MFTHCCGTSGRAAGLAGLPMKGTLSGSAALFHRCVCAKLHKLSPVPLLRSPPLCRSLSPPVVSQCHRCSHRAEANVSAKTLQVFRYFRPLVCVCVCLSVSLFLMLNQCRRGALQAQTVVCFSRISCTTTG